MKRKAAISVLLVMLVFLAPIFVGNASVLPSQHIIQIAQLIGGEHNLAFGYRVAISDQWGETAQLNPDPPGFQACFGESVDLDGDLLVVGAYGGGDYSGYAYVFTGDPDAPEVWTERAQLTASDGARGDFFGYGLDLSEDRAWIGAPLHQDDTGRVYLYARDHG